MAAADAAESYTSTIASPSSAADSMPAVADRVETPPFEDALEHQNADSIHSTEVSPPSPENAPKSKRSGAARRRLKKERQARVDAQFAGLEVDPTKPPRLPVELVYHVLELLAESDATAWTGLGEKERSQFLRTASLVCSLWRAEAQRLLRKTAILTSNEDLRSFASALVEVEVSSLQMRQSSEDSPRLNGRLLKPLLRMCRGLQYLQLDDLDRFSPAWLRDASFSNLKHLILGKKLRYLSVCSPTDYQTLKFPFKLETIRLVYRIPIAGAFPFAFIDALLGSSVGAVSLAFRHSNTATLHSLPPCPLPTTPFALTELILAGAPDLAVLLKPFMARCTSLKAIAFYVAPQTSLLGVIPSFLRRMSVRPPARIMQCAVKYTYHHELIVLRAGFRCLSKLRVLATIQGGNETSLRELKDECDSRGIELQVRDTATMDQDQF